MRNLMLTAAVLAASLSSSGCRFIDWHRGDDDHREKWESVSDGDYSFVMNRSCFCYPAGMFDVVVENYAIVSMVNAGTGEVVDGEALEWVHTIDQMFDLIEEAKADADVLEVEYSDQGYPTEIVIDWWLQAADDEIYYGVSDVVIAED